MYLADVVAVYLMFLIVLSQLRSGMIHIIPLLLGVVCNYITGGKIEKGKGVLGWLHNSAANPKHTQCRRRRRGVLNSYHFSKTQLNNC